MKIYLSHSSGFDYQSELYEPLKQTLSNAHEIFFPHDKANVGTKSKDIITVSDYVIAEVSYPSTGQGIELGWADASSIPIICLYRKGAEVSNSLSFVSDEFIEYTSNHDMIEKLEVSLSK